MKDIWLASNNILLNVYCLTSESKKCEFPVGKKTDEELSHEHRDVL